MPDEYEKTIIESVIKGLIESFFKLISGADKKEKLRQEFKDYLNSLANSLDEIIASLEKGNVPHGLGTQIDTALENFETKIKRLRMDATTKEKILSLHKRIKNSLTEGRFIDDYLGGRILYITPAERNEKLVEMKRTSGSIKGYAMAL
jgi:hypothetical protein